MDLFNSFYRHLLLIVGMVMHLSIVSGQVEVIDLSNSPLSNPLGMDIHEDVLYIADANFSQGGVYVADLSDASPELDLLEGGLSSLYDLIIHDSILYVSNQLGEILRRDLRTSPSNLEVYYSNLGQTEVLRGMGIVDEYLYIVDAQTNGIQRLNYASDSPTLEFVYEHPVDSEVMEGMTSDGQSLYYVVNADPFTIYKLDLSAPTLVAQAIYSTDEFLGYDLHVSNDVLYFSMIGGGLWRINLTGDGFAAMEILEDNLANQGIASQGDSIYFQGALRVFLLDQPSNNDQEIIHNVKEFTLSPNPSGDIIRITGMEHRDFRVPISYKITTIYGSPVIQGRTNDKTINITTLPSGTYVLTLDDTMAHRIVKL